MLFAITLSASRVLMLMEPTELPWWADYPGMELWRFINLFLFAGILIWILRKPLSAAFKARREGIRQQLQKAEDERNAALAKLKEVETRLSQLSFEVEQIGVQARDEAAAESARLARMAEDEVQKIRQQAALEIKQSGVAARQELRMFSAEQSVMLAEQLLRKEVTPADDARLINLTVQELGGAPQ